MAGIVFFIRIGGNTQKVSAAWWDEMWHYRKAISITNTSGSNLTDFQVSISIGTSQLIAEGKMQSDCDDIRITDINGNLLPYWIEENNPGCNQLTDTKVWLKANSLPTSGATVYVYYGNASAETASNVTNTFGPLQKLSLGSSYTVSPSPNGSYPDNGGTQLTNGLIRENLFSSQYEATVGWLSSNPTITINLNKLAVLSYFKLYLGGGGAGDINIPTQITTSYSIDNSTYNSIGIGSSWSNAEQWVTINSNSLVAAKYGQATITANAWVMVGEIEIYGYPGSTITANTSTTIQSEESGGGPIAYWKFDEGVGSTVYDSSSNNHKGTLQNGTSWASEDQCISGKCLKFDGIDDYVNVGVGTSYLPMNTFSMCAWVKSTGLASGMSLNGIISYTYGLTMALDSSGQFWTRIDNGSSLISVTTPGNLYDNKFHYLCVTFDGTNRNMYVDGKLKNSTATAWNNRYTSNTVNIGHENNSSSIYKFNGWIDEPKIYNYARTADQIKQDYNSRGSASSQGSSVNLGSNKNSNSLSDGLVGYWKMDEGVGTNITDSSGNNNTGTFGTGTSAPTWTSGKFGIGTSFDGNDYINAGTSSIFNLNNQFSFETWINVSSLTPSWQFIMGKSSYWGVNDAGLHIKSTGLEFFVDNCRDSDYFTITTNKWYHIVGVYNGTNRQLYVDGKLEKNSSCTGKTLNNAYNFSIGADNEFTYNYSGLMDDVRLYNRALSPSEVSALYNYAPGPVGYWDFNDGSGNNVIDKSGNNNNGTWSGTGSHWTTGKIGSAGNFNGSNDVVNTNNIFANLTDSFTISAWVNPNSSQVAYADIFGNHAGGGSNGIVCQQNNTTTNQYYCTYGNGSAYITSPNFNLQANTWQYLTFAKNSTGTKVYVNSIEVGSTNSTTSVSPSNYNFKIGQGYTSGRFFNGKIDDVKIYNYARSQKQIIEDMNAGAPATSAKSMVAYYKFDEGSGTTANNSGLGNSTSNGILYNSPIWTNEGKIGKTLSLNGSNTYIKTSGNLDAPANVTVTAWIKANNTSSTQYLVNQARDNYCSGYGILLSSNNLYFKINANSADDGCEASIGTSYLDTNKWHYIAGSYDGKTTKLYIDGVLKNSSVGANGNIVYKYNEVLNIGKMAYGEPTLYFPFNGLIDEVKIYNYALTDEEIKQDYNAGSAIQFGTTTQNIGGTTTSLEYCIPGDASFCAPPIAEWKMDEGVGTSIVDTSGNNNTGTISGATWTQGKIGKSLNFNGTSGYVSIPTYNYTANTTISVWVKGSYINGSQIIVGSPNSISLGIYNVGSSKGIIGFSGTSKAVGIANNFVNDSWNHLSVVIDSSGNATYYCNGQSLINSGTNNWIWSSGAYIGRRDSGNYFKGQIDQLKIYDYARTPAQIAYDYNKGAPVGWWKFDECQGNIAYDWSGIGNTGVITIGSGGSQNSLGTCAVGTSAAWTNGATGKINSSLNFDGVDDYISIPNNNSLNLTESGGAISLWFKTNTSATGSINGSLVAKTNSYGNGYWFTKYNNKLRISLYGTSSLEMVGNKIITDNIWHHAIANWTPNTLSIYIDGILDKSQSYSFTMSTANQPFYVARMSSSGEGYFQGQIDDVRIYNYALTSEQIKQIYNGGAVNFR